MSLSVSQNKGEWSELYAFIKLLADGQILYVDKEAEDSEFIAPVDCISKDHTTLTINNDSVFSTSTVVLARRELLGNWVKLLYENIKQGKKSFKIPEATYYANQLGVSVDSKSNQTKGDLSFKILKPDTGKLSRSLDVSVKSWIGSSPTLFNASKLSTRLIYKVTGVADNILNNLTNNDPRGNLKVIYDNDGKVTFLECAKATFQRNLQILGASETLAYAVLHHFTRCETEGSSLEEISRKFGDPVLFKHKLGGFLRASALGMTGGKTWEGTYIASDNILIVSNDGSLKCLIGRGLLENHLFQFSMIDTPSTTRHEYGNVYKKDNEWHINLNFQIRLRQY